MTQDAVLQASVGHHREHLMRQSWSAWLGVVRIQARAVRQRQHSLRERAFSAMLTNAAAAQRQRQVLAIKCIRMDIKQLPLHTPKLC